MSSKVWITVCALLVLVLAFFLRYTVPDSTHDVRSYQFPDDSWTEVSVPEDPPRGAELGDYIVKPASSQEQVIGFQLNRETADRLWAESMFPSLIRVDRVVDGDTVVLDHLGTVRLIGIDTPETVHPTKPVECYGPEASAFLKGLLFWGRVRLEYGNEFRGNYGRQLFYLFREDGLDINLELVRQGYARAYRDRFPHPRKAEFVQAEDDARARKVGLWGKCGTESPL